MIGAILPLFHMPAWRAQGLYLYLTVDRLLKFLTDKKPKAQLIIRQQSHYIIVLNVFVDVILKGK
jgi:hypothetical protein